MNKRRVIGAQSMTASQVQKSTGIVRLRAIGRAPGCECWSPFSGFELRLAISVLYECSRRGDSPWESRHFPNPSGVDHRRDRQDHREGRAAAEFTVDLELAAMA